MKGEQKGNDALDNLIREALIDLMENEPEKLGFYKDIKYVDITPEYIVQLAKKRKKEARQRRLKRLIPIAVACALVLVISGAMALFMPEEVDAVKDRVNRIFGWEDLMDENQGNGSQQTADVGGVARTFDKWEDMEAAKKYLPELYIPEYVPGGYEFSNLTIQKNSNVEYLARFVFIVQGAKEIIIVQRYAKDEDEILLTVSNATDKIKADRKVIYITADEFSDRLSGVFLENSKMVNISGEISIEELEKIVEGLKE